MYRFFPYLYDFSIEAIFNQKSLGDFSLLRNHQNNADRILSEQEITIENNRKKTESVYFYTCVLILKKDSFFNLHDFVKHTHYLENFI